MIILSAGHTELAPGAKRGMHTEHAEARQWVEEIYSHSPDSFVHIPSSTNKEKLRFVEQLNSSGDVSLWVELHFDEIKEGQKTPQIQHNPKRSGARESAEHLLHPFIEMGLGGEIVTGYYKGLPEKGMDYLLSNSRVPTLIIIPCRLSEIDEVREHRDLLCLRIAQALGS